MQLAQGLRQRVSWNVKQRGVGEHAIEMAIGQFEPEKILLPYLAAAVGAGHGSEARSSVQSHGNMAEFGEPLQVTPRSAAEVKYREGGLGLDVVQQRRDVLANVVIARTVPIILGVQIVIS